MEAEDEEDLDDEVEDLPIEVIVAEAATAVDLTVEEDAHLDDEEEPKEDHPEGVLVFDNKKEDDIPVQTISITGATADPVKDYLKQIGKVALLNAELEVDLAKRIEAGLFAEEKLATDKKLSKEMHKDLTWVAKDGQRAKAHLLEANLRLVVSLAKRYTGRGMQFLDLIQEGNLGLIRAVEKFDYTKGYKFSTYGGFARRSLEQWLIRREPFVFRCTWLKSLTNLPVCNVSSCKTSVASLHPKSSLAN